MKIAGIIAEYDPFHKGHAAHIAATRQEGEATHVVCVISGSFTQRGEPALVSKFDRARMALDGGADLVLELPLPWAMAPAEMFAAGGIALLKGLGCVDTLSFGSECGDTALLQELAALDADEGYRTAVKQAMDAGLSYPAAMHRAARATVGDKAEAFTGANNTLAIEYIRAARRQGAHIGYYTLQRHGADHNGDPVDGYASAGWIRQAICDGEFDTYTAYVPHSTARILEAVIAKGEVATDTHKLETAIMARLRTMKVEDFAALPYISEGLENRLWQAAQTASCPTLWLEEAKTKRYTYARLRRLKYAALVGLDNRYEGTLPPYIRVLGLNKRGKEILAAAAPTLPLLTRVSQLENMGAPCRELFALEERATDLHALAMPSPLPCGTDRTTRMITTE